MRIAFLGTPGISAYVLDDLAKSGFEIVWVATQPDKPSGRGLAISCSPVKTKALELGIPVLQTEKFDKNFMEEIKKYPPIDIAIVIAYGLYLPTYFLSYPKHSCINIHLSLLPKYRGASPVATAIVNGDAVTGVTIMQIVREMDAGDIIAQAEEPILIDDDTDGLELKLTKTGTELLKKIINPYVNGEIKAYTQLSTNIAPSFTHKIKRTDAVIDWAWDAKRIHDMVRAMYPWPGVEVAFGDKKLKLIKTKPLSQTQNDEDLQPGVIRIIEETKSFVVGTGAGSLLVEKIQASGKKEMTAKDFVNGYRIKNGMRFN